jgi:hypothetical protein
LVPGQEKDLSFLQFVQMFSGVLMPPLFKSISLNPLKKDKANPLQAWTSPDGSRRLRLPDFKTIGT